MNRHRFDCFATLNTPYQQAPCPPRVDCVLAPARMIGRRVAPLSEVVAHPDRNEPVGLELESVDALVNRELNEGEGAGAEPEFRRDPGTHEYQGIAAIGRIGIGAVLASVPS